MSKMTSLCNNVMNVYIKINVECRTRNKHESILVTFCIILS